jgi:hypothetical protein
MPDSTVAAEACVALGAPQQQFEAHPSREVTLGRVSPSRKYGTVNTASADGRHHSPDGRVDVRRMSFMLCDGQS